MVLQEFCPQLPPSSSNFRFHQLLQIFPLSPLDWNFRFRNRYERRFFLIHIKWSLTKPSSLTGRELWAVCFCLEHFTRRKRLMRWENTSGFQEVFHCVWTSLFLFPRSLCQFRHGTRQRKNQWAGRNESSIRFVLCVVFPFYIRNKGILWMDLIAIKS